MNTYYDESKYQYKILIPHDYLEVKTKEELYDKLMNDEIYGIDMEEHNDCLALEIDECMTGFTDIDDMYIILANKKRCYEINKLESDSDSEYFDYSLSESIF